MIGRNITNHSLEKKEAPCFDLFGAKTIIFLCFPIGNAKFCIKSKTKEDLQASKILCNSYNSGFLAHNWPNNSA